MTPLAWTCAGEPAPGRYVTSTSERTRNGSPGSSRLITSRLVEAPAAAGCCADANPPTEVAAAVVRSAVRDPQLNCLLLTADFMAFSFDCLAACRYMT